MPIARICEQCGKEFWVDPSVLTRTNRGRQGRFCSRPCKSIAQAGNIGERFWSHVDKSAGPDTCWPWRGAIGHRGYGVIQVKSKQINAHRLAWELTYSPIPRGLICRHLICDNPPCCNPSHLAVGTHADNGHDKVMHGRSAKGERNGAYTHPERRVHVCGERNGAAKLTEQDVRRIRELVANGAVQRQLAKEFSVSPATICHIIKFSAWKHVI